MTILARGAQRKVCQITSTGAPTRGINDTDPLPNMPEGYAISSYNMFPGNGAMQTRPGTRKWAHGIVDGSGNAVPVKRLFTYNAVDGSQQFFASTRAGIFDISQPSEVNGVYTSPVLVHPLTNGVVTTSQFANTGGNYLIVVNGTDPAAIYDGSAWVSFTQTGSPSQTPPIGEIQGVDPTTFIDVIAFKGRLWFVQKNTMSAWYLETDSVAGPATEFLFGGVFGHGGYLYELATWSYDSGSGMDDNLIVRSSAGEIAIYQGTDPENVDTFSLVSVFFVSVPVGKVAYTDLGGDCLLLCKAGIIPISKIVSGVASESLYESTLTRNISKTLSRIVNSGNFIPNWEIHNIPLLQAVVVVMPASPDRPARQYVMNVMTGAWGEYDLSANCIGVFGGVPYFGTVDGKVFAHNLRDPARDNVNYDGTGGSPILSGFLTAFSYFGDLTTLKHYKLVRPIIQASLEPTVRVSLALDFNVGDTATFNTPVLSPQDTSDWDSAVWDEGIWGDTTTIYRMWSTVVGLGFCAAVRVELTTVVPTSFVAYELSFEVGGAI